MVKSATKPQTTEPQTTEPQAVEPQISPQAAAEAIERDARDRIAKARAEIEPILEQYRVRLVPVFQLLGDQLKQDVVYMSR